MSQQVSCPEPAGLKKLLDGTLPAEEQTAMTRHLDVCEACRETLEDLAGKHTPWLEAGPTIEQEPAASEPVLCEAMANLKAEPVTGESQGESGGCGEVDLSFLSPPEKPGQIGRFGPYEVIELIGRGGMGIVLKAFDPALHRFVAIKVLAPQLATNATARRRFTREAQAAAAVSHDHVVTIHAVDEANGLPYLVMQYIAGVSLQERIDCSGPLELKEILRIGMQTAEGLAAAHAQGLVHRDVKPANILLENGVERVKITDFGLARAVDDASLTQSGVVAGTPQYMSPEQGSGGPADYRTDLFSLGSVLYAMCTGRPPFRADNSMAVLRRICDESPRPVQEVNPAIPEWLAQIIAKLHAKNPADRFQSALEVARLLERYLAGLQQGSAIEQLSRPSLAVHLPHRQAARPASALAWKIVAAAALLAVVGLGVSEATGVTRVTEWVGQVLRIRTAQGTLLVEVDDPNVQVTIDGEEVAITDGGVGQVRLHPGSYQLQAARDGVAVKTQIVTIERDRKAVVKVSLEPQAQQSPAVNLLKNPGFEERLDEAGTEPAYWLAQPNYVMGKPQARCQRDTEHKSAGEASLVVAKDQFTLAEAGFFQNVSGFVRRETLTLSGQIRTQDVEGKAFLAVRFVDRTGNFVDEIKTEPLGGTSDWRGVEVQAMAPESSVKAVLAVVLQGKGAAWFDEVNLTSRSPARAATTPSQPAKEPDIQLKPGQNLLGLGDFEASEQEIKTAWLPGGQGLPGITMRVDKEVKHGGESSVTVINKGPSFEVYGWRQDIFQAIPVGRLMRLNGHVKTKDCVFAGVCVQLLDADGDLIGLPTTQGKLDLSGTHDWTPFRLSFYVPRGTVDIAVLGMISGQGQVWFDDFDLVVEDAK